MPTVSATNRVFVPDPPVLPGPPGYDEYSDIPGMSVTLTLQTAAPIQALFWIEEYQSARFAYVVDGIRTEVPQDASVWVGGILSWNFLLGTLAAGSHTVKMQWKPQPGSWIYADRRTLTVVPVI